MLGGCLGANSRFGVGAALSGTTGHELKQSPQTYVQAACVHCVSLRRVLARACACV